MLSSDDQTWVISKAMYWSVIETNIGILAASIPSYKSVAKSYAPRLLGSSGVTSGKPSGVESVPLGSVGGESGGQRGAESRGAKNAATNFQTRVKNGLDDNSSEEVLITPQGRIGVKTEIIRRYEDARSNSAQDVQLPAKE